MPSKGVSRPLVRLVADRAGMRCEYCRIPAAFVPAPFEVDHIIPRAKGGLTTEDNLAYACACNAYKGDRTRALDPLMGRVVPLFNPRRQVWKRHFQWSEDAALLVGRTATGRATVALLQMNRPSLINLRRALIGLGEHPPAGDGAYRPSR